MPFDDVFGFPSRMLTAIAETIDKQWADMFPETQKERHDEPTCCGARHVTECRPTDARADETSQAVWYSACEAGPGEVLKLKDEVKRLTAEVERLRLRPEELAAIRDAMGWFAAYGHAVALILASMLKRLGGGE